ncbi:MAG: neutral/alkaline non-lysosomal ceramidase N-terminal domain-containing protein [Pirellulales bacterium]
MIRHLFIRWSLTISLIAASLFAAPSIATSAEVPAAPLEVAFGHVDITPKLDRRRPVYLAGFGMNRRATGVHDPLYARAVVMHVGGERVALVSVDLIGLQHPAVKQIRDGLKDYKYVMVSSTHSHEGPDVIGIWGPSPFRCGVDFRYVDDVAKKIITLVQDTEKKLAAAEACYGVAEDESLLGDSRQPKVYDGILRVVRFNAPGSAQPSGILVQWNCHPESMGSRNTLLTADFPYATIAALEKQYKCPIAYFSGAVGGLMAPPDHVVKNDLGDELKEGDFAYCERYGQMVAKLAAKAIDAAEPIDLSSITVSSKPIAIPLDNMLYKLARALGVLQREGREWTGDAETLGKPISIKNSRAAVAVETEVAYLRLGQLHVACIPGEIYPELVYGKFQDPAEADADYPHAPLEKSVASILPGDKWLLFGLANDEIGYIIPKRQWDQRGPFAYGGKKQYGEINSCGPEVAPIVMQALENRVREATPALTTPAPATVGQTLRRETDPLAVGVATIDITAPVGYRMSGYFNERPSTGTHDPLQAKAIVLRQGDTTAALVVCDLIGLPAEVSHSARTAAEKKLGIPAGHITIAATHSHTGPLYFGALRNHLHDVAVEASDNGRDPREAVDYPQQLADKLVEAIASAHQAARPATIASTITRRDDLSFNRRFHMRDGTVRFNPGKLNPDIVRVAGPIDPDVGILAIQDTAGKTTAALTSFALHLDTVGGTEYGADYPYYLQQSLRGELGDDFTSLFGTGTCGDINHIDVRHDRPQKGQEEARRIGEALAETVIAALPSLAASKSPRLGVRSAAVEAPLQRYTADELVAARADMFKVGHRKLPFLDEVKACTIVDVALRDTRGDGQLKMEVQAIRLDDETAIVCLPGELFVDLGLAIKQASPFARTLVIELCNDDPAYIPTRKAFAEGSYETVNSRIQPGGGEMLVTAALKLLGELKND